MLASIGTPGRLLAFILMGTSRKIITESFINQIASLRLSVYLVSVSHRLLSAE